jgi:hypothetical protein
MILPLNRPSIETYRQRVSSAHLAVCTARDVAQAAGAAGSLDPARARATLHPLSPLGYDFRKPDLKVRLGIKETEDQ